MATITLVPYIPSEVCKYFRIHPNSASRPVWCEKMFLCCCFFPPKPPRKDLTNRHKSLPPPPPPSYPVPLIDVKTVLAVFCRLALGVHISCIQIQHFLRREEQGGGGGGGENFRPTVFVKSFLPALREKNNTGTSFHVIQLGLWSLGGFWHTWKFQSKWH